MAEGAQRLASLVVVGGALKNHRFDLQEVVTEVLIGSDAGCHLKLELPSVSPIHARIWADLNGATVHDTNAPRGLFVNDDKVEKEAPIKNGDWLWLGAPGDPESVCIQSHFEEWVEVLPDASGADAPASSEPGPADSAPIPVVPVAADEPIELMDPAAPPELPGASPAASSDDGDEAPIPVVPMREDETTELLDRAALPEIPASAPVAPAEEPPVAQPAPAPPPEPSGPAVPDQVSLEPEPSAPESTGPPPAEAPSPDDPATVLEPEQPPVEAPGPPAAEAPPATPPDARAEPVSEQPSGEDAFFVDAGPPPSEERPSTPPEAASAPPATPAPVAPDASDPFFVGEATTSAPEPAPPATTASDAPAEDHFFISGDAFTDPEPPTPAQEDVFVAADSFEPQSEAAPDGSTSEAAPTPGAEAVLEAEPVFPADEAAPVAETPGERAPSPPPEVGEEILAAEVVEPLPTPAPEPAPPPSAAVPELPGAVPPAPPPAEERPRPVAPRRAPAAGRRPARRAPAAGSAGWLRPIGMGAGAAIVLAVIAFGFLSWLGRNVKVEQVSPTRVRVGQRATITGSGFSENTSENTVLFGDARAGVLNASSSRLEVAVPEAVTQAGTEKRVTVTVKVGDRSSEPVEVSVFQGPRLHGLSPDVAMPGEEVLLAGVGWGVGATVRFGDVEAEVLQIDPTEIRVAVPQIEGHGTAAPVVVAVGGIDSNAAPFFVGRLPLLTGMTPSSSRSGEILTLAGRGLGPEPDLNAVQIAGRRALVVSARSDELQVVVPRLPPGDPVRPIEVFVAESEEPARGLLEVAADPDPLTLRFVAEPFDRESTRDLAVLATDLGPAFVLAAANGRTAAHRATEAQGRLNAAVDSLARAPGLVPEARDLTTRPVIALAGRPDTLLQVTAADAAAYNDDWTRLRGRGGPVTPPRLARWWEAVTRDLVLMLVRGERPRFPAALAPEGRVLQRLFDSASGGPGIPRQAVIEAVPAIKNGLRLVGLRVPASVTAAVPPAPGEAAAAAPTSTPAPLELEGQWSGTELEGGRRRYLTVTFRRTHGTIAYEGGITLTVPFLSLERPRRNRVRFTVQIRGGIRHYLGQWDGEKLSGDIAKDEAGNNVVGTFELKPR